MKQKFFFGFFIVIFLFLASLVSSEGCISIGQIIDGQYCSAEGILRDLKIGGATCLNDYECLDSSCIDEVCQSTFPPLEERSNMLKDVWYFFSGEECDPEYDIGYHCEGAVAFLCGASKVWEEKGEIPGVCGVVSEEQGGSSINIIIFSPKNVTYSITNIPLQVIDKSRRAKYWKYSLNEGEKKVFEPNITITARTGSNLLKVYASKYQSFSGEKKKEVVFSVVSSNPNPSCGDGICGSGESCSSCERDCGACQEIPDGPSSYCGDNVCDIDESSATCPEDCKAGERRNLLWLFYVLVALIIVVIALIIYFLIKRFKKNKGEGESVPKAPATPAKPFPPTRPISTFPQQRMGPPLANQNPRPF